MVEMSKGSPSQSISKKEIKMASLASVLGLEGIQSADPSFAVLDIFFGKSVILLNDVAQILGAGVTIPIPIVGFEYQVPNEIEMFNYRLSEYPALNKQTIINSMTKGTTKFSITAIRPITKFNTAILNYALNEALNKALELYNDNGGTYTIITPWGLIKPCVMSGGFGIKIGDGDLGGQGWRFNFTRLNIQTTLTTQQSAFLASLGGAV